MVCQMISQGIGKTKILKMMVKIFSFLWAEHSHKRQLLAFHINSKCTELPTSALAQNTYDLKS